jgi:hypothetical protein
MTGDSRQQALVDTCLAEFNALKREIGDRSSAQNTLVNLSLTAVAAVVGVVATHPARASLLLLLTVTSPALGRLYADHARTIVHLAEYIDSDLRTLLSEATGRDVLAWEERYREFRQRDRVILTHRFPVLLIFVGPPIAALIITALHEPRFAQFDVPLWLSWFGGLFLTAYIAILFVKIQFSADREKGLPQPKGTGA